MARRTQARLRHFVLEAEQGEYSVQGKDAELVRTHRISDADIAAAKRVDLARKIEAARATSAEWPVDPTDPTTIWFLGGRAYEATDVPARTVNYGQHKFLQEFKKAGRPLTTEELEKAGVSNPTTVAKLLESIFGTKRVRLPAKKKGAGYMVRVLGREAPPEN
jgi:hypothetical protein